MTGRERLIVPLDVPDRDAALALARTLVGQVGMVKVGFEAFVAHGPALVHELHRLGHQVFLDLKVHDIPRTAAAAAREASRLGVRLLTVHAAGGRDMIAAAREALDGPTQMVAVTVLTSLDATALADMGHAQPLAQMARRFGEVALEAGAHGLVCSPHELSTLGSLGGLRVVPGVRPVGTTTDDQKRVATPVEALAGGATWLVVGRPILRAEDPAAAAALLAAQLDAASP